MYYNRNSFIYRGTKKRNFAKNWKPLNNILMKKLRKAIVERIRWVLLVEIIKLKAA